MNSMFTFQSALNMPTQPKFVPDLHVDRQWDCRFNIQLDDDLERLLEGIRQDISAGRLRYILVGGPEIGQRPYQTDYNIRHVHVAAVFANRVSKSSIIKNWRIKTGNGYYLVPRNRDLPYTGWRSHHIKEATKIDPTKRILLEHGELPADSCTKFTTRSEEEKKRTQDQIIVELRELIEANKEEEAFKRFPRTYLQWGEKIKTMILQSREHLTSDGHPHIWVYGPAGTGKSAILNFVYPKYYKKNLYNKFFDLYDPREHSHVMLEDLDHEAVDRLSVNFLKTICDESGFPVDQKYKTPQLARAAILVTSNFTIQDVLLDHPGITETIQALARRFWMVHIDHLMVLLGVKLLSKYERDQLKRAGNTDVSRLFINWNYSMDAPTGKPICSPEHYQELIKNAYYN